MGVVVKIFSAKNRTAREAHPVPGYAFAEGPPRADKLGLKGRKVGPGPPGEDLTRAATYRDHPFVDVTVGEDDFGIRVGFRDFRHDDGARDIGNGLQVGCVILARHGGQGKRW